MHFYTHNIGDFALATQYLTDEELGIYVRMRDHYLSTETPLRSEWIAVALRTHCGEAVNNVLSLLFVQKDSAWHNEYMDRIIEEYREKSEKAAESARKRWEKVKENQGKNRGDAKAMRTHSKRNAKAMLTNNQEPITNNQEINTNKHLSLNRVEDDFLDDEPTSEFEPEPVSNGKPTDVPDAFQKFGQNPVKAPDRWGDDGQCFDAPLGQLIDDSNLQNNQEALQNDNHVLTASQIIVLAKTLGTNLGHSARLDEIANRKTLTVGMVKMVIQDWKATRTSTGYLIGYLDNVSANPNQLNGRRKDREITAETISNGQAYALAKKLGNYHSFASNNAYSGETMDAFIERVSERLKDPDYFEYCRPYLVKCGAITEATA